MTEPNVERVDKLIVYNNQSLGDIVMMTAAARDVKTRFPGTQIDVRGPFLDIWENNPHLSKLPDPKDDPSVKALQLNYPLIAQSNTHPYHFIHGMRMYIEQVIGQMIPQGVFRGDIHLTPWERENHGFLSKFGIEKPGYWLIISGGKDDFTTKIFDHEKNQAIVDKLQGKIRFVQVGGKDCSEHHYKHLHKDLNGVVNLVGKTSVRELIQLVYWSDGVICPITGLMHLAPAIPHWRGARYERAGVVLAGGRETPQWEQYPFHRYLHTVGCLKCCSTQGCWISRVTPLGDEPKDRRQTFCHLPVVKPSGQVVAGCLDMMSVDYILNEIDWYFRGSNSVYKYES